MVATEVKIANQVMRLECDNPQELTDAASELNSQIENFRQQSGNVGDMKIISIIALTLQDKVFKLQKELEKSLKISQDLRHSDRDLLPTINSAAERIKNISSQLQGLVNS